MYKKIILGVLLLIAAVTLVVVLLSGGNGGSEQTGSTTDTSTNSGSSGGSTQSKPDTSSSDTLNPKLPSDTPYKATTTVSYTDGRTETSSVEDDGNGNTKIEALVDGLRVEQYDTDEVYVQCLDGVCSGYLAANKPASLNSQEQNRTFDEEGLGIFINAATFQGEVDCSTGRCHEWSGSSPTGDSVMLIDIATNRIVQIRTMSDTISSSVTDYEYVDVTIAPPSIAS